MQNNEMFDIECIGFFIFENDMYVIDVSYNYIQKIYNR